MVKANPMDRFWLYVDRTDTCWLWTGAKMGKGYGLFWADGRKVPAHRWYYEQVVSPVPDGLELDHVKTRGCTSMACVNPAHLEPVTHAENRKRSRLHTCRRGLHDLTDPANMRWDSKGQRRGCRLCHMDRMRERKAAAKEKTP